MPFLHSQYHKRQFTELLNPPISEKSPSHQACSENCANDSRDHIVCIKQKADASTSVCLLVWYLGFLFHSNTLISLLVTQLATVTAKRPVEGCRSPSIPVFSQSRDCFEFLAAGTVAPCRLSIAHRQMLHDIPLIPGPFFGRDLTWKSAEVLLKREYKILVRR
jgi:hypothetical protein